MLNNTKYSYRTFKQIATPYIIHCLPTWLPLSHTCSQRKFDVPCVKAQLLVASACHDLQTCIEKESLTKGGWCKAALRLSELAVARASLRPNQCVNQDDVGWWSSESGSGRAAATGALSPPSSSSGLYSSGSTPFRGCARTEVLRV